MKRAQSSWILGLIAGLLVGAVIWFGLTQMPFSPLATNSTSNTTAIPTTVTGLDRADCIRAAVVATACLSNGTLQWNANFTYGNQTFPCHCNTPESDASENLSQATPWPEEDAPQPTLEPWPDPDRIRTTVVAGPGIQNASVENQSSVTNEANETDA